MTDLEIVVVNANDIEVFQASNPSPVVEVVGVGPQGAPGEPGAPGAAPQAYRHVQSTPASTWLVAHNLGYKPAIGEIKDSGGSLWFGTPNHVDDNNFTVSFFVAGSPVAFSGELNCS